MPGNYEVRLTVDGKVQNQLLTVVMDPRSPATSQVLAQQLRLGRQIFNETMEARRTLAEIDSVQRQLAEIQKKVGEQKPEVRDASVVSALTDAQSLLSKMVINKQHAAGEAPGLQPSYTALESVLRVVESGDRAVPSQAVAVYNESSPQAKTSIAEWKQFKQTQLARLNQQLGKANLAPIAIAEIEREVEHLMSQ